MCRFSKIKIFFIFNISSPDKVTFLPHSSFVSFEIGLNEIDFAGALFVHYIHHWCEESVG